MHTHRGTGADVNAMQQIQLKDEGTGIILAATVRPEFEDGQPRVRDLDLGEWLGYQRPRDIRGIIQPRIIKRIFGPQLWHTSRRRSGHAPSTVAFTPEDA